MARNLGAIVGALAGGALSFLAAKKYEIPLMAALGPAYYPLALATGTIAGCIVGKRFLQFKIMS
ncbi:hypothetical protein HYX08_06140 [Candidatus Woesearchaeota archaeon]|nr:hypothetical protein [Candidatus Woesearchaeota archaeon]